MSRPFRSQESLDHERRSRELIAQFLKSRGFSRVEDVRKRSGTAISQTINSLSPEGERMSIRVKLCWRPRVEPAKLKYFAAQLIVKVKPGEAESKVNEFALKAARNRITHFLFVQPSGDEIVAAALVPVEKIATVWSAQRTESDELIRRGLLGNRKKNHAENGHSPTIWLKDDDAPSVAEALWRTLGVVNLLQTSNVSRAVLLNDSFQDIFLQELSALGMDSPPIFWGLTSNVKRDEKVRRAVLQRADGVCERVSCGASRDYPGFLDVHHILGIGTSDRIYNCVALCPNCHREAHISPLATPINAELLEIAKTRSRCRK